MIRFRPFNAVIRLSSWAIIIVLLLGGSYHLPASARDKAHKFIEIADQATPVANPLKIKPVTVKELGDHALLHAVNRAFVDYTIAKDFQVGGSERNCFYALLTANAP